MRFDVAFLAPSRNMTDTWGQNRAALLHPFRMGRQKRLGRRDLPADPYLAGQLRDGPAELADLPAHLRPGPLRHAVAGSDDIIAPLGPRRLGAQRFAAAPDPLGRHQPGRPSADRQVP